LPKTSSYLKLLGIFLLIASKICLYTCSKRILSDWFGLFWYKS
jgi:hypothetical protein